MPNALAYAALLVWPLVAWALYTRLSPPVALIWTLLGGYMVLPPAQAAFDLPAVPALDKFSIASLSALALTVFLLRDRLPLLPRHGVGRLLVALFLLSPFATSLTNPDPILIEAGDVPALRLYDSISFVAGQAILLIPFVLARRYLGTDSGMRQMVWAFLAAGLVYSVPMLVEARLSPQINTWVYGFFQHDFSQSMRGGGFRPMVFLPHGLWVAFFALMAVTAALAMLREATAEERPRAVALWAYLAAVLVACRSAGPLVYALGLTAAILVLRRRTQLVLAAVVGLVVITYPLLRGAHLVPLDDIVQVAEDMSPDRAESLRFRIDNEEVLLARAQEKPWFGWGGYGRNLILDPVTGRIQSIPDGGWIIVLGTFGWVGYIAQFGLLVWPLLLLGREALARGAALSSPWGAAITLIYAANLADLLPNNTLIPLTWLMSGALTAWAESLAAARRAGARPTIGATPSRTVI